MYCGWYGGRWPLGKVILGVHMQVKLYPKPLPGGSTPECCQYCMPQHHPLECQQSTSGHNSGKLTLPPSSGQLSGAPQLLVTFRSPSPVYMGFWRAVSCAGFGYIITVAVHLCGQWLCHIKKTVELPLVLHSSQTSSMIYEPCRETFLRLKHSLLQGGSLRKVNNKIALGSSKNWPIH